MLRKGETRTIRLEANQNSLGYVAHLLTDTPFSLGSLDSTIIHGTSFRARLFDSTIIHETSVSAHD